MSDTIGRLYEKIVMYLLGLAKMSRVWQSQSHTISGVARNYFILVVCKVGYGHFTSISFGERTNIVFGGCYGLIYKMDRSRSPYKNNNSTSSNIFLEKYNL